MNIISSHLNERKLWMHLYLLFCILHKLTLKWWQRVEVLWCGIYFYSIVENNALLWLQVFKLIRQNRLKEKPHKYRSFSLYCHKVHTRNVVVQSRWEEESLQCFRAFLGLGTELDGTKNQQQKKQCLAWVCLERCPDSCGISMWNSVRRDRVWVAGQLWCWKKKKYCGTMTEIMGAYLVLEIFVEISRAGLFAWATKELWI